MSRFTDDAGAGMDLLCGHSSARQLARGDRVVCSVCGSFLERGFAPKSFSYDESYPQERRHTDPFLGELKVRALRRWLDRLHLDVAGKTVCEVGFGGGFSLAFLARQARAVYGVEVIADNLRHAQQLGIPARHLFDFHHLPDALPSPVDLWLFQDSFEHLDDPAALLRWAAPQTSPAGRILIVCPRADSLSQRLLGRLGPHRRPDHPFHWSRAGLIDFLAARGFRHESSCFPLKYVSLQTLLFYVDHYCATSLSRRVGSGPLSRLALPFNLGEMALLFVRAGDPACS